MTKKYQFLNDKTCLVREVCLKKLSKEEVKSFENDYKLLQEEGEKQKREVSIPDDEELVWVHYYINHIKETLEMEIFSREKWRIAMEEEKKKELEKEDYEIYEVNLSENNWLRVDGEFDFDKKTLLHIEDILGAKDFEVIVDSHMEEVFVAYQL